MSSHMKNKNPNVRIQRPSVPGMTVQQERKCLAEIRSQGPNISTHYILENGMYSGDFALKYVLGQHAKRQEKNNNNNNNTNTSSTNMLSTIIIGPYEDEDDPLNHTVSQTAFPTSRKTLLHKGQLTDDESGPEFALIQSRSP